MPKCRLCKTPTEQRFGLTHACSIDHAIEWGKQKALRLQRKETAQAKLRIKTLSMWRKDAQKAFNAYIRERDRDLPCISCGTFNPNIQYCAGHYLTVGSNPALRFDELNVHKQCNKYCNLSKSGNQQQYRIGLLMKLGEERVLWLEGPHEPKQYRVEELQEIIKTYRAKLKELKANPVYPV